MRSSIVRLGVVACGIVVSLCSASPAHAVLTSDNTNIGAHPGYGGFYSAFWRSGFDYSVLTSGTNTYLNAPSASGNILFRSNNGGVMSGDPDGGTSQMWLNSQGLLTTSTLMVQGGAGLSGMSEFVIGILAVTASTNGGTISGTNNAPNGVGVKGSNTSGSSGSVGIQGVASGVGIAVRGDNTSASGWAAFFNGRAFTTAGVWTASDVRLKKDIKDSSYGLKQIREMRPVTYQWRAQSAESGTQVGLIAQELQKIVPEAVVQDGQSGTYSVNYTSLIPVLIKAVKEQDVKLKIQEDRIAALERERSPLGMSSLSAPVTASLALLPLGVVVGARRQRRRGKA